MNPETLFDGMKRIQSIGMVGAVMAERLLPGDRLIWNYGYVTEILTIEPKGKMSLEFTMKYTENDGSDIGKRETHSRTMRKNRLVAVTGFKR